MTESSGYCVKCGTELNPGSAYCHRCGASVPRSPAGGAVQPTSATDWREQRRQARAQRRAEHQGKPGPHVGGLVLATILIVVGLGVFFPEIPWSMFWGALFILLGVWVAYMWTLRPRGRGTPEPLR